ncbi:hypothetical protein GDO81_014319 [Engystomops pustulosus]|uniref:Nicotinamide N-methyltransferase-like n=1 Tax=Engystomops pustulosus TaxID=76066 RepID=A0AAV7B9K3_ENGPU|nr:hypothetical protein GDO81_014319 [Engystomops pustulosus]
MASFSTPQVYIEQFNPKEYLQEYYSEEDGVLLADWVDFTLRNLNDTFTKGGVGGNTLLDFGTGPTIYQLLSACEAFDKIIASDFLEQNRAEIRKWLRNDPDAFDWTPYICLCDVEKNGDDAEQKSETLRNTVKQVMKCDVHKKNPYDPIVMPPVDCLLSCLCLEFSCKDMYTFTEVLKNLQALIKPGGYFLIFGVLSCSFYYVGEKRFTSLPLKQEELEMAFYKSGT